MPVDHGGCVGIAAAHLVDTLRCLGDRVGQTVAIARRRVGHHRILDILGDEAWHAGVFGAGRRDAGQDEDWRENYAGNKPPDRGQSPWTYWAPFLALSRRSCVTPMKAYPIITPAFASNAVQSAFRKSRHRFSGSKACQNRDPVSSPNRRAPSNTRPAGDRRGLRRPDA